MRRVALYSEVLGSDLLECNRDARRRGDRVVSTASEAEDRRQGRQVLYALLDRMLAGEFDAIIASLPASQSAKEASRLVNICNTGDAA